MLIGIGNELGLTADKVKCPVTVPSLESVVALLIIISCGWNCGAESPQKTGSLGLNASSNMSCSFLLPINLCDS